MHKSWICQECIRDPYATTAIPNPRSTALACAAGNAGVSDEMASQKDD